MTRNLIFSLTTLKREQCRISAVKTTLSFSDFLVILLSEILLATGESYSLNLPKFCFFFPKQLYFYKTKVIFEVLKCNKGHMPIFLPKIKKIVSKNS